MKKNWKRHLLIGIFVALIFFGWFLRGFLWINWRFKLFSIRSWNFLLQEFRAGWMLNAVSDWIFLLSICFAVPCFLYIWYLCTKVKWRTLMKKIFSWLKSVVLWPFKLFFNRRSMRLEQEEGAAFSDSSSNLSAMGDARTGVSGGVATIQNSSHRPRAMSIQHTGNFSAGQRRVEPKTTFQMSPNNAYAPANNYGPGTYSANGNNGSYGGASSSYHSTTGTIAPTPNFDMENESYVSNMGDMAQMPLEEIHLPERPTVVEDLDAIFAERGYQVISKVKLQGGLLDYVAVSKDTILACLLDQYPSDWLADEESFNGEDPLWFSEVDHRVSPVFILKKLCDELKNILGEQAQRFMIKPLLIEQKGNIINAEDMMKSWVEMNVSVCRTDKGGPDDLTLFGDFVKQAESIGGDIFISIKAILAKGE